MDDNPPFILAIAQCGSINKAAKKMHISQPALSQRLKQVELNVGASLFDRSFTPLKPTQAGKAYLDWAQRSCESESLMRREIAAIADNSSRQLHVGVSIPRATSLLPYVLERFYAQRSGCVVVLHEAAMPETYTQLLSSEEIDFSIFIPKPPEASLFASERICVETMMLIAPEQMIGNRFTEKDGRKIVDPALVASFPLIVPPGHLKHSWLIESLAKFAQVKFEPLLVSCSNELTFEMMDRGLGATIMPNTFVPEQWRKRFGFYAIDGFSHEATLYYARLERHELTEDERIFVQIVRELLNE